MYKIFRSQKKNEDSINVKTITKKAWVKVIEELEHRKRH